MFLLFNVMALGFGIAGVPQRRRKRPCAVLGMACSTVVSVISYVEDE